MRDHKNVALFCWCALFHTALHPKWDTRYSIYCCGHKTEKKAASSLGFQSSLIFSQICDFHGAENRLPHLCAPRRPGGGQAEDGPHSIRVSDGHRDEKRRHVDVQTTPSVFKILIKFCLLVGAVVLWSNCRYVLLLLVSSICSYIVQQLVIFLTLFVIHYHLRSTRSNQKLPVVRTSSVIYHSTDYQYYTLFL